MTHASCAVSPVVTGELPTPITFRKQSEKTALKTKMMNCEVVFGSPSLDCGGTGICRITGTNSIKGYYQHKNCSRTLGQIAAAGNGTISLFFFREFLCIRLYRKHFYKGVFSVTEACPIPPDVSATLGIEASAIVPGQYVVREMDGYFRVDLLFA